MAKKKNKSTSTVKKTKTNKTCVIIQYDAGFPNQITIRGEGAGLSWIQGIPLKNIDADQWVWEPKEAFEDCEFKVLINDQVYELGENHHLEKGQKVGYTPKF